MGRDALERGENAGAIGFSRHAVWGTLVDIRALGSHCCEEIPRRTEISAVTIMVIPTALWAEGVLVEAICIAIWAVYIGLKTQCQSGLARASESP